MKNPGYYNDRLLNAPVAFLDMRDVEKENFNQMFVNSHLWEKFVENMVQILNAFPEIVSRYCAMANIDCEKDQQK